MTSAADFADSLVTEGYLRVEWEFSVHRHPHVTQLQPSKYCAQEMSTDCRMLTEGYMSMWLF